MGNLERRRGLGGAGKGDVVRIASLAPLGEICLPGVSGVGFCTNTIGSDLRQNSLALWVDDVNGLGSKHIKQ